MMSRTTDTEKDLVARIKECNNYGPDLAIDIHHNAGGGNGAECFYFHEGGMSKELAQNVLDAIVTHTEQNSRGIKTRLNASGDTYYGFIRQTFAPAIICEVAFLDNAEDVTIVDTFEEQVAIGEAIARGILKSLDVEWIPKETTAESILYRVQCGAFRNRDYAEAYEKKLKDAGFDAFIVTVKGV